MLLLDTLRTRWAATLAWGVGGGLFHVAIGLGYVKETERLPGGAAELARGLEVAVRSMRVLRWPAERLDTVGGYLTYHNVTLLTFLLALWAAYEGVHVTRGARAERSLELILATGYSRAAVLRDRLLGFAAQLVLISLGMGLGLFGATAIAGAPDALGAALTTSSAGCCALAAYAFGLAVAQVVRAPGPAMALTSGALTVLYMLTNVADLLGPAAILRYLSPFFFHNQSLALLPGRPFSPGAFVALLAMATLSCSFAAWAFSRRDLDAGLWRVRPRGASASTPHLIFATYCWSELWRSRWRLLGWSLACGLFSGLMVWLTPAVTGAMKELEIMRALLASSGEGTLTAQYLAFAADTLLFVVGAFAAAHAGGWAAELRDQRVELMLSQPVSWARLVLERFAVLMLGAVVVTAAGVVGLLVSAAGVDVTLSAAGVLRTALAGLLLALAIGGLAALLVAWLRGGVAVTLLLSVLALSYLQFYLVPIFAWPSWVARLSLLGAVGHPYVAIPPAAGLVLLGALALGGGAVAVLVSRRRPAVG